MAWKEGETLDGFIHLSVQEPLQMSAPGIGNEDEEKGKMESVHM